MQDRISTRRAFLQRGLTLLATVPTIPAFLDQTILAMARPDDLLRTQSDSGADGKILVIVQLSGGNDGLSTVVPHADDVYHRLRPALAHKPNDVLKISDEIGLHPNLAPLKDLYDDGRMSVVQGVGYPNPNRSHFRSTDVWHTAQPEKENVTAGWLGKYFDNTCAGCDPHIGVSLGESLPLAMQGGRVTPLSFEDPQSYRYKGDEDGFRRLNELATRKADAGQGVTTGQGELDFLHRTAMDAQLSSDRIIKMTRGHVPQVDYPKNEFGNGLRTIAAMIRGGLPTRVYYTSMGGFDTHAGQRGRHDNLMRQFAQGIGALMKDLKQQGNADRVLVMTFSEFGRRVVQNASGGTDHGAAAPMFFFGPRLKPGVVGPHPSLTDLDHGDLKYGTDFRSVYATVLQHWMDTPSKPVLGRQFKTLPLLRG